VEKERGSSLISNSSSNWGIPRDFNASSPKVPKTQERESGALKYTKEKNVIRKT